MRIGLRILAVQADRNTITAAYSAIPLVEDTIRTYVVRIYGVSTQGLGFSDVTGDEIGEWWNKGEFIRPSETSPLSGAELVVLAAVLSGRSARPLFADAADVMRLVERLAQLRNHLGHHVRTPDRSYSRELTDCAEQILDAIAQQGNIDLSVRRLASWVNPPQAFFLGR